MRTQVQIDEQLTKLRTALETVPLKNSFGDNNCAAIEAAIDVLERQLDQDEVYDTHGSPDDENVDEDFDEHVFNAALSAVTWLHGHSEDAPGDGWAS